MAKLVFGVQSENPQVCARISRALAATGLVEPLPALPTAEGLDEILGTARLDGLYVDLDGDADALLTVLERASAPRPALVFGGSNPQPALLVRAMRLQPLDFLMKHDASTLAERIEQLSEQASRRAGQRQDAHGVLAVAGSKGGVGTTFVACELACALQQLGERAAVVDLNLRFGDAALYFDLKPAYTLADVAKKGEALDDTFLNTVLVPHLSGVRVLAAPSSAQDIAMIGANHIERAVTLLREQYEWVILDMPGAWDDLCLRALNTADQILLVTRVDVPSLKHTKQQLDLLERFGAPRDQLRVIVNRHSRSSPFSEAELADFLGREPDLLLPADDVVAARCVNEGKQLREAARGGKLERSLHDLADLARGWVRGEIREPPSRSLTAWLMSRVKGN